MKKIDILECTLRDGSYPIHYQFTKKDTEKICIGLENLGFKYIEVGHGLGFNASASKGNAAETDETYLKAAHKVLKKAKFGMFFIPGIGRREDLELGKRYGMHFVRIGTNITEVEQAKDYVKYAKKLGFIISFNLMKSYVLPPKLFAKKALLCQKYGADIIVLVDSVGGMFPNDVKEYIYAMKNAGVKVKIGFHGHNNFSLAIANTLMAIESGATIVDSTLMGMGRSAGNAQTEILVAVLKKLGFKLNIDMLKTMDFAEKIIRPFRKDFSIDSIAITSGYGEFHSSFSPIVAKAAKKYHLDIRKLILAVCKKEKVNVTDQLAESTAKQLQKKERFNKNEYINSCSPSR